jgi:Rad3-related DNA helicase
MLSDSLFAIRRQLQRDIAHYASEPFEKDYPNSQRANLILALYHLQLAQMAFDSFQHPDNHIWSVQDKKDAKLRAIKEFEDAINQINSD